MTAWLLCVVLAAALTWRERERRAERERLVRCAHEVRGPLTALGLALHGAGRRGELPPVRLAGLELELRRAALALDDLRGGPPAGREHVVDVADLLAAQVATWREVGAAHGVTLALHVAPGPAVVHGDAVRLAQATGNLLANAIEHGGGHVAVRLVQDGDLLRVEVHDGGPGLPEVVLRPAAGRGARGHGLSIAAAAVRRHGGRLRALPAARGARLALELPAAPRP